MKVAIDAATFCGVYDAGKEEVLQSLLRGFTKLGHGSELLIICTRNRLERLQQLAPQAEYYCYDDIDNDNSLTKNLKLQWRNEYWLPKIIRRYGVDLIFFTNKMSTFHKLAVPSVALLHDVQPLSHPDRFNQLGGIKLKIGLRLDYRYRDKLVAISKNDQAEQAQCFPQYVDKCVLLYNPVYAQACTVLPTQRQQTIVAINLRYKHKNGITLVKAFAKLLDKVPHDLLIVGAFEEEVMKLVAYVNEQGMQNRVRFLGKISDEAKLEVLSRASLFVNPSLYEGFGITPIEAMLAGVPTLTTKESATPEITRQLCRYYEPATDADALAEAMLQILHNPPSETELLEIAQTIDAAYNYKKIAADYWQLFTDMLSS